MTRRLPRHLARTALAGSAATLLLGLTAPAASADSGPPAPSAASRAAAHKAAETPGTLDKIGRASCRERVLLRV